MFLKLCSVMLFFFLLSFNTAQAGNLVTLHLYKANLLDTIRLLSKSVPINVMISPSVQGTATVHFQNVQATQALEMLLATQGLAKWRVGNIWYIAPRAECLKQKQEQKEWQYLLEASSPLAMKLWQIKYAKASEIARFIQDEHASLISKRGKIRIDHRSNVIFIQDGRQRLQLIDALIKKLDVPVQQIAISARLVSIDCDFERELGINFIGDGYSIAIAKLADGSYLDVKLSALENAGHAELISRPSLFTENQKTASIEAGEEVPYQETSDSGGTAVTFKKAVLGLQVTPHVMPGHRVLLTLRINQDRPSNRLVMGVPTISTRKMVTHILVKNGQTVVLGGIYEFNQESVEHRLPYISKIPLLGLLFKQRHERKNKRELLIFVTPKMIS